MQANDAAAALLDGKDEIGIVTGERLGPNDPEDTGAEVDESLVLPVMVPVLGLRNVPKPPAFSFVVSAERAADLDVFRELLSLRLILLRFPGDHHLQPLVVRIGAEVQGIGLKPEAFCRPPVPVREHAHGSDALGVAGVNLVFAPPPLVGGPVMRGLPNTVFLHERPGYRWAGSTGGQPTFAAVIDMVRLATQYLEERERAERRRRRNPLYWIDRVLRMTLGIPAYLVSLLAGVPRGRVETSAFGPILRLIGVLGDLAGLYALGKLTGLY
jgi:hypothetical protein